MKVLLADENPARSSALLAKLQEAGAHEIVRLAAGQSLAEAVASAAPDVVIVDMARADRDSLDGVREMSTRQPKPIVMFVDQEDEAFMAEAIASGVSSYNVVGTAIPDIKPIVQTAVAIFERFQRMSDELTAAQARLNERAIIERAKGILMSQRKLAEPQAYSWLRRNAMNRGKRIVDIANELIRGNGQE